MSEDMDDNHFAPIYKENDRTNVIVYRSVKFQKIHIGIPRCKNCKKIHHNSEIYSWILGFVLAVGVVLLITYFFRNNFVYKLFFGIIGFFPTLILTPPILATIISARQGIFSSREGAENEPQIKAMIQGGWTLSQPNA